MKKKELLSNLLLCLDYDLAEKIADNKYAKLVECDSFKEWKRTFVGAFLLKYPKSPHVIDIISLALEKRVPQWEDFTKLNLLDIRNYLTSNYVQNTAKVYSAYIAATLGEFKEEGVVPCKEVNDSLSIKKAPSQHTFLTMEEIELIHNYVPKTKTEADIKRWFLIECYTGARTSDARKLSMDNIRNNMLYYISQKTKIESCVPLHKNLLKYLVPGEKEKEHNRSVVNNTLRKICKSVGICKMTTLYVGGKTRTEEKYKFVSTHTARRSFATNLSLAGERISVISAYMGHTSIDMTSKYIVIDTSTIEANRFFYM